MMFDVVGSLVQVIFSGGIASSDRSLRLSFSNIHQVFRQDFSFSRLFG